MNICNSWVCSGYNQIAMQVPDQYHTSFIRNMGLHYYKVMSFGLKNTKAAYQRLVNKMFVAQIGCTIEVYVDNILVNSKKARDHVAEIIETFEIVQKYDMKLIPLKCSLGLSSKKFLGFIVNSKRIEANPVHIWP